MTHKQVHKFLLQHATRVCSCNNMLVKVLVAVDQPVVSVYNSSSLYAKLQTAFNSVSD